MRFMKRGKNIFWGVVFLLGAAALILSRFGYLKGIGFWSILWNIILLGFLLNSIFKRKISRVLFAAAFLIIANDEALGLEAITPWPVLGAALLGSIGLQMIFPKWSGHFVPCEEESWFSSAWHGDSRCFYECNFGEAVRYISGEVSAVSAECNFGFMQLYFSDAKPVGGKISVDVETKFGTTVLYVPSSWKTAVDVETFCGDAAKGKGNPEGETVLYVRGEVAFGSLVVRYI